MIAGMTARLETPITVAIAVDGTPYDFNRVAAQLAGALSHAMLPGDAEMPSREIADIIDRFVYQPDGSEHVMNADNPYQPVPEPDNA